jgi:hypothetical protein
MIKLKDLLIEASGVQFDWPKDLRKLSKADIKKGVDFLAKKPIRELRKNQDLLDAQIKIAYDKQDELALSNLQIMRKLTDSAVDVKSFGNK